MAKIKADKELYFDTATGDYYVLNPDGTYDQVTSNGSAFSADQSNHGLRKGNSTTEDYISGACEWNISLVGATSATAIDTDGTPVVIGAVRVAGTANLGGAATIALGTIASNVTQETIPAAATPGTERDFKQGTKFPTGCVITVAVSGTVMVLWRRM